MFYQSFSRVFNDVKWAIAGAVTTIVLVVLGVVTFMYLLPRLPALATSTVKCEPVASPVVTEEMIRLVEARTKCASELLASTPTNGSSIDRQSHLAFVKAYCEKEN